MDYTINDHKLSEVLHFLSGGIMGLSRGGLVIRRLVSGAPPMRVSIYAYPIN